MVFVSRVVGSTGVRNGDRSMSVSFENLVRVKGGRSLTSGSGKFQKLVNRCVPTTECGSLGDRHTLGTGRFLAS